MIIGDDDAIFNSIGRGRWSALIIRDDGSSHGLYANHERGSILYDDSRWQVLDTKVRDTFFIDTAYNYSQQQSNIFLCFALSLGCG
jgi:hypothetical protein